jgi:arylsulfatase A-like enzyme
MHHVDEVDLPPHRTLDLERRPWWHRQSLEGKPQIVDHLRRIREEYSRIPVHSDRQLRELIANYYGMISLIDHNVGRILLHLEQLGLAKNTLVAYSSDHGDWLGDHGLILKGPMAYEGLLRVGLLLQGPGIPKARVVDDPVSTVDLPATFADYAGVDFNAAHSRSLRKLVEGKDARDFAYSEWDLRASRSGVDLDLRTVRTRTHKLTVDLHSGAGELYDLANDPFEMENRFNDPGTTRVQKELTDMIRSRPRDVRPRQPQVGMA